MKIKQLASPVTCNLVSKKGAVVSALLLTLGFAALLPCPTLASDNAKMNKWFDDINSKYPNLNKKTNVGGIQNAGQVKTPGAVGKAGNIQTPGNIQAPQGFKAIKTTNAPCSQRFLIGADTLFEFDKATLTPRAEETLSVLGPMIQNAGEHPVTIEGHTDSVGTDEYNQTLSERRAERVRNWLLEHRAFERRAVTIVGYGEKKPIAPNEKPDGKDNPAGRALNRRVEIVVNTCAGLDQPVGAATEVTSPTGEPEKTSPQAEPAVVPQSAEPTSPAP